MQLAVNSASIGVDIDSYCDRPHVLRTKGPRGPRYNEWLIANSIATSIKFAEWAKSSLLQQTFAILIATLFKQQSSFC